MRSIYIIKVGSTFPELAARKKDFEHWVAAGLREAGVEIKVVKVQQGEPLPKPAEAAGVVVTGSHAMVTDRLDWSERVAAWLPKLVEQSVPFLGICYGHQLLAHALGGEVRNNPNGREFGTVPVRLDPAAQQDALLGGLPGAIDVQTSHTQSVVRLPAQARHLASSAKDPNHAFIVGTCAWGVQFHPEFDAEIVRAYIEEMHDTLRREGQDPEALKAQSVETEHGPVILHRFGELVHETLY